MAKRWLESNRSQALKLLGIQTLLLMFLTLAVYGMVNLRFSVSFMLGGWVSLFPAWIFTLVFFKDYHPSAARKIVSRFYWGEVFKLLMIACLFMLAVTWVKLALPAFMTGLFLTQMGTWLAPILFLMQSKPKKHKGN